MRNLSDSAKVLSKIFDKKSLLDLLMQADKFLDDLNVYVYPNWINGQVVDGPNFNRYWVWFTLKYPYKDMPDPYVIKILERVGAKVKFEKGTELEAVDIETPADYRPNSKKPKQEPVKVWYVELKIPRKFIDEDDLDDLDIVSDEIDVEDVSDSMDQINDVSKEESGLI